MAAPPVVVRTAEGLGLVAPTSIVDLPAVPLERAASRPRTDRRHHQLRRRVSPAVLLGRRARALRLVLVVVFLAMAGRLVAVQELSHQHYAALSASELTQQVTVPAVRGGIYDRSGEVLAETVTKSTVVADPLIITHPARRRRHAGSLCSAFPPDRSRSELTEHSGFVYLAHRVPTRWPPR